MLRRAFEFWLFFIGSGLLIDYWLSLGEANGDTLSEQVREKCQTHTPLGKVVFTSLWVSFALWFWWHIILKPLKKIT